MEVGQLEAFERAAREGSFTAAAAALGLTQPAISTRIAALERELGGPLFERGGKRLSLTSLGESVLPYADKVLSAINDAQEIAHRHREGKLGSVTIAALDTLGVAMLPEPMTAFLDVFPSVDFTIRLRIKQQILKLLHDGRVTLGLSAAPLWDKGVRVLARFRNPIRAAVSINHPLAKRRQLTLHSLQSYPIYRSTLSPTATALIQSLTAQARQGNGTGDIYIPAIMAAPLLLQGQGVTFVPQALVQKQVDDGQLLFLQIDDMPDLFTEPLLITMADRELDTLNTAFVQMLCERWQHMRVD
ncbi:MAG: LysR family transcriptional regulator [Chloroflexota bacterium]